MDDTVYFIELKLKTLLNIFTQIVYLHSTLDSHWNRYRFGNSIPSCPTYNFWRINFSFNNRPFVAKNTKIEFFRWMIGEAYNNWWLEFQVLQRYFFAT